TAPGRYEARLPSAPADEPRVAVISRGDSAGPSALVARTALPAVQTAEWPATVSRVLAAGDWPANAVNLSADLNDPAHWDQPGISPSLSLTPAFWLAAVIAALLALWLRG